MRFLLPLPGGFADGPGFLRGFQPYSVSVRPWLPDTTRSVTWVSRVKLLRWRCAHGSAWSLFWYWDGLCMGSALPWPQLECPERVWGMVESGSLARGDITESPSTMDQYNCSFTDPETRPFAATSWILFGAITGFVLGAPLFRNSGRPVEGPGGG